MALNIKNKEADRLARALSRLTGESLTEAVTKSLAERLKRVRRSGETGSDEAERILAYAAKVRKNFDLRPATKAEWDEANGRSRMIAINSSATISTGPTSLRH